VSLSRTPIPKGRLATVDLFTPAMEYLIDAAQRSVLARSASCAAAVLYADVRRRAAAISAA
jgi:hypothetical protein